MSILIFTMMVIGYLVIRHFSYHNASYVRTHVYDGDSIRIDGSTTSLSCRIIGYDAPEWNQPYGREATIVLKGMLADGYRWRQVGTDDYGRALIDVRTAKGSIARLMVEGGHGHNCAHWGVQQFVAHVMRRGLWAGRGVVSPRTFRMIHPK